jgi:hypothetical protein
MEKRAREQENDYVERGFEIGQRVKRKREGQMKLHSKWDGPFVIHDETDKNTYQL